MSLFERRKKIYSRSQFKPKEKKIKAFDALLKIDGIPNESSVDKHKDWIEIVSFVREMENSPRPLLTMRATQR